MQSLIAALFMSAHDLLGRDTLGYATGGAVRSGLLLLVCGACGICCARHPGVMQRCQPHGGCNIQTPSHPHACAYVAWLSQAAVGWECLLCLRVTASLCICCGTTLVHAAGLTSSVYVPVPVPATLKWLQVELGEQIKQAGSLGTVASLTSTLHSLLGGRAALEVQQLPQPGEAVLLAFIVAVAISELSRAALAPLPDLGEGHGVGVVMCLHLHADTWLGMEAMG